MPVCRSQGPKDFIPSLGSRRLVALRTLTLTSPSMEIALEELTLRLPLATNLHTLNLKLPLRELRTREDAVRWASNMKGPLRNTNVKEVTVQDVRMRPARAPLLIPLDNLPPLPRAVLARIIEDVLETFLQIPT